MSTPDPPPKKKRKVQRLQGKYYFLTYPQCDIPKEEVMGKVKELPGLQWAVIGQEKHKDGTDHLHVVMIFKDRTNLSHVQMDALTGKHGNYQLARKLKDVVKYATKDGDYISHQIDVSKYLEGLESGLHSTIARLLQEGSSIDEIDDLYPGYVLQHKKRIDTYTHYLEEKKSRRNTPGSGTLSIDTGDRVYSIEIGTTLPFRTRQYWIYGPTGVGKTSLVEKMCERYRGYLIPTNNDFCFWDNKGFDFSYIDEFKGQLTIQFLNQWLDGQKMHLNFKGGSKVKLTNLVTLIISNFSPEETYRDQDKVDTLLSRLHVIPITTFPTLLFS